MTAFYAKSTGGFYHDDVHGANMPADAAEITAEDYKALMRDQSEGKVIRADGEGKPEAVDRPAYEPTVADEIKILESQQTTRRIREYALGEDGGWLKELDAKIAALRAKL